MELDNKTETDCCALSQLSYNNFSSLDDILNDLDELRVSAKDPDNRHDAYGEGETTVFVITTPAEEILERKLQKAGYICMFDFKRRLCTAVEDEQRDLKFWVYKFL
jgi:hypothetical protein